MAERTCKRCFHYEACKEVASHSGYADINYTESQCKQFIPTADVVEVKHGYWKTSGNEKECSVCGFVYYSNKDKWNGCPNCLSKMDGGNAK